MVINLSRGNAFGNNSAVFIFVFLGFSAVLLKPFDVMAKNSPVNRLQTPHAKALTIEALELIEKKQWGMARDKIAQSKDPLAAKIFHWMLLGNAKQEDWTNQLFISLSQFVRYNPEWPDIEKMKVRAEGVMPESLSNDEVIAWYDDFPPQTPYGMGRYMDALIINGKKTQAKKFLADWWSNSRITRAQQRKILQDYDEYLTLDAHKRRFDALLLRGDYENGRAMAALLGQGYPALAEARIALSRNSGSGIGSLIAAVPERLKNDPGLLYERLRWRRKRNLDEGAVEILYLTPDSDKVQNPKDWWQERHIIIRRLLQKGEYQQAYELAAMHIQHDGFSYAQAQWMAGWMALRFIHRPTEAYERFSALYTKVNMPVSKARAAYWAGRAAQDMGQMPMARGWYQKAAEYQTTFYGQLAGAALSMKDQLPKTRLPYISSNQRKDYEKSELVQASELFREIGEKKISEEFMDAFLQANEAPKSYRFAAEMVASQGNYKMAVKIAKKATSKGLFLTKQSYPTITKQLKEIHYAEWALVHAIIRQESMFDYKAQSGAGARGLMQLMPATARSMSKQVSMPYKTQWLTAKPKYNMTLGAYYIAKLVDRYNGSYPLAIAAYNAGPSRVDAWIRDFGDPREHEVDLIDWIELIPIYETRNYVQRVMEGVYVYRLRLKNIQAQPDVPLHVAIHVK
tara:strand:- start:6323 stop:8374 length:2052 start_codon:yes stop_codon:yes gene_type:complete